MFHYFHSSAGQPIKRLLIPSKWAANSKVHKLFTRGVKTQNTSSNCLQRDSMSSRLLSQRFNGILNFQTSRKFYLESPLSNARIESWCLKPKYTLYRNFHVSECRKAAPILPVIGALLARFSGPIAQFLKLMAVVAGRTFRRWWKKLPDHQKQKLKTHLFSRKELIAGILSVLAGGWLFLYYIHLEEAPYTNRSRYVGVSPKQIREIAESHWRTLLENYADDIVPVTHPDHKRVFQITERLIRANADDIKDHLNWEVNVISSDEINAFVLPNGQIFVFTGLLRFLSEDNSLAIILGHEIAHAILQHSAEQLCFNGFINLVKVVMLATIWALIPSDLLAFLTQSIQTAILGLLWNLPYSRTLEEEADRVGLYFAAKACFDVREGPRVWQQFGALEKLQDTPSVEWLSTHPSHENRERNLEGIVPEALALRKMCKCPELTGFTSVGFKNVQPLTLSAMAGIHNRSP